MALREIITLPDPRLRQVSEPVVTIDGDIRRLADDMLETMYAAPGIGLAAIQVGVRKRVITLDLAKKDEPPAPQVFINAEVVSTSEERATYEEGCLSIPEYYDEVERPSQVKVRYTDLDGTVAGNRGERLACDVPAARDRPYQRGAFIDHLSKLKRDRLTRNSPRPPNGRLKINRFHSGTADDAPTPDLHGHARVRGTDADHDCRARPRRRGGLYARSEPAGRGMALQTSAVEREARRLSLRWRRRRRCAPMTPRRRSAPMRPTPPSWWLTG